MALTNDQITAQNFKDFYGQIRPYLNGQVPTFANQFSRSDLCSTDEKIIGQWIDGKPLYQKTIDFGALPNNTTKSVNHNIQNIDYVVNLFGAAYRSSDGVVNTLPCYNRNIYGAELVSNSTSIMVTTFADRSTFSESYVTIQYTKTTDSAIKVGTGTDYSTDEQIIGTWIDGKPIYQKTIVDKTPVVTTDGTAATKRITISANLGKVISYNIYHEWGSGNSGGLLNDCYTITGGYTRYIRAFIDYSQNAIAIITDRDAFSNQDIYITIQYTKTTD